MTTRQAIVALQQRGYSKRRISRELGIHRKTVGSYLEPDPREPGDGAQEAGPDSKCTISTPGPGVGIGQAMEGLQGDGGAPEAGPDSKCTISTPGSGAGMGQEPGGLQGPGGAGRASECEPYREIIEGKLEARLQGKRIWRDLVDDHGFAHGYQSVKRFVARLKAKDPKRVWRMECEPGQEAQVDYGTQFLEVGGKRKKVHFLRVILSHSRKGYTEAMPRQDTESFIRGIENAMRHFGGVPQVLVLDNLKAGVLKANLYDPELNPKFAAFCEHYEVVALPTRPRTPQHKGKVESAVGYVKESALKARSFASFAQINAHLRRWEATIADKRIHGTTRRQVGAHFEEVEKPALRPLAPDLFPSFVEGRRRVHRDSYIEFGSAFYEVPPEYIARDLWVRSDGRMVHIFNERREQVAVHARLEAGQFTKVLGCGGTPKSVAESLQRWEARAAKIGPDAALWARGLILRRKQAGLRVLMGLIHQLLPRYGAGAIERACAQARMHGQYRLAELKDWLEHPAAQESFSFLCEHELIRDMAAYGQIAGFEQNN